MLPKALLAAALATSATSAFLLPPPADGQVEHHAGDAATIDAAALQESPFYSEVNKVEVPCPGCPVQVRKCAKQHKGKKKTADGELVTVTDRANHLELVFRIDHAAGHDRLLLNGFELFPDVDPYRHVLTAAQVLDHRRHGKGDKKHSHDEEKHDTEDELKTKKGRANKDKRHRHHRDKAAAHLQPATVPLGYALQVHSEGLDAAAGAEVVTLSLEIIEVNGVFVQGVPTVSVRLVRTADNALLVARIETDDAAGRGSAERDGCDTLLCRCRAYVAAMGFKTRIVASMMAGVFVSFWVVILLSCAIVAVTKGHRDELECEPYHQPAPAERVEPTEPDAATRHAGEKADEEETLGLMSSVVDDVLVDTELPPYEVKDSNDRSV